MMTSAVAQFIVERILDYAQDAIDDAKKNKNDEFYNGKKAAYYEVLNMLKNELDAHDENLKEYGLNVNLEKSLLAT